MLRKYREWVIVGIDLLLLIVVVPPIKTLRLEYDNLIIKQTAADTETEESQPSLDRQRVVIVPRAVEPSENSMTSTDDFISETRRRAAEDPERAMRWLQDTATGPDLLRGMLEVVAIWAGQDSEDALLWLESNAQGIARLETFNSGIEIWSQRDPAAAAAWIDGMADDGSKVAATRALAANWIQKNPLEARRWINSLPPNKIRDEAAAAMVESWISLDPEAATNWALAEAEFNGNSDLLNQAIRAFTQADLPKASLYIKEMAQAVEAPEAIETYVTAFAEQAPEEALQWALNLSEQDFLYSADHAKTILQTWSQTDSVAASAWLNEQAPGPTTDAAIVGFANTLLQFDPEAAATWSNAITDPKTRIEKLDEAILSWAQKDSAAALNWLKSAPIEPEFQEALILQIVGQR